MGLVIGERIDERGEGEDVDAGRGTWGKCCI